MSGQAQMPQPPKEFIITADGVNRFAEIINSEVPTGPGNKLLSVLQKSIKPYEAPTAPEPKK